MLNEKYSASVEKNRNEWMNERGLWMLIGWMGKERDAIYNIILCKIRFSHSRAARYILRDAVVISCCFCVYILSYIPQVSPEIEEEYHCKLFSTVSASVFVSLSWLYSGIDKIARVVGDVPIYTQIFMLCHSLIVLSTNLIEKFFISFTIFHQYLQRRDVDKSSDRKTIF